MATVADPRQRLEITDLGARTGPIHFPMSHYPVKGTLPPSQLPGDVLPIRASDAVAYLLRENIRSSIIAIRNTDHLDVPTVHRKRTAANYSPTTRVFSNELALSRLFHDAGHQHRLMIAESALAKRAIDEALRRVHSTSGVAKISARTEAVQAINRAGATAEVVDRAVRSLVDTHHSGRLDDAIDLLAELGGDRVRALVMTSQRTFPPNESNDDYWYAVIRAAGRTGDRQTVNSFLDSGIAALKEAAVEALGDIGDSQALEGLRRMAGDPNQPRFIRQLALELVSDVTSNEKPDSPVR